MNTKEALQESINNASSKAKVFFLEQSIEKTRDQYFSKGGLGDDGKGAVYAYLDKNERPLYLGESSRPIKRRMHDQTSPHKKAFWWSEWKTVRFIPMQNRTDRLTLELLLILKYQPKHNTKPGGRNFLIMFDNQQ